MDRLLKAIEHAKRMQAISRSPIVTVTIGKTEWKLLHFEQKFQFYKSRNIRRRDCVIQ